MELGQGQAGKQDRTSLVELKNGKVNFRQKPISFEKQSETLQEIVSFRAMLEDRIHQQEPPVGTFPDAHKPLIAKLAHESDKTLSMLTKHIHHELLPTLDDEEKTTIAAVLPLRVVEEAIKSILLRNNYGLEAPSGVKLPAALLVWRWEVRSEHLDWLPKNGREKAEARLAERVQAREDLKALLEALPQEERDAILDPRRTANKLPQKDCNRLDTTPNPEAKVDNANPSAESSQRHGKTNGDDENEQADSTTAKGRLKKPQDSEKNAKEKQEKKSARQEKERKERDAQNRSQSLMTKFFAKPKAPISGRKREVNAVAGPSKMKSDFEQIFKPFVLGKDKVLAPQNWFQVQAQRKRARRVATTAQGSTKEVIVLESEDEIDAAMTKPEPTGQDLESMTIPERLQDSLSTLSMSLSLSPSCRHRIAPGFKVYHAISVRDLMIQLSGAEISGNDDLVRELLKKLNDRETFPAKALCFHANARPGYFGTWTRSSKMIGPRRPLTQDTLLFDYAYDSGEEWEEEPMGEDVVDDGDEEDGDNDDRDSDMDSWLVDDDEEIERAEGIQGSSPPPKLDLSPLPKRKAEDSEGKSAKKRKVVVPLAPFAKGPVWESTIGQPDCEPFNAYTISFFNDTPFPINPFAFVSRCLEDYKTHQRNIQMNNNPGDGVFILPAIPPRLISTASSTLPAELSSQTGIGSSSKRGPTTTKSLFPDAHVAELLNKINQLQASSITALVEAVYQDLREHKIKKIAIETKIKEVGEKCKDTKIWIVKPALMQQIRAS